MLGVAEQLLHSDTGRLVVTAPAGQVRGIVAVSDIIRYLVNRHDTSLLKKSIKNITLFSFWELWFLLFIHWLNTGEQTPGAGGTEGAAGARGQYRGGGGGG